MHFLYVLLNIYLLTFTYLLTYLLSLFMAHGQNLCKEISSSSRRGDCPFNQSDPPLQLDDKFSNYITAEMFA